MNEHQSLLVRRYLSTKFNSVHNKDEPLFDDQFRPAFCLKQEAHLRWTRDRSLVNWVEFVRSQVRANKIYSEEKCPFSVRNRALQDLTLNSVKVSLNRFDGRH